MNRAVSEIMAEADIRRWLLKYYSIPAGQRNISVAEMGRRLQVESQYIRAVFRQHMPMGKRFQVRFSRFVDEFGWPAQIDKTPKKPVEKIPDECYEKLAGAIAALDCDMAKVLQINPNTHSMCKNGAIPNFPRRTFKRIYATLTGEDLPL